MRLKASTAEINNVGLVIFYLNLGYRTDPTIRPIIYKIIRKAEYNTTMTVNEECCKKLKILRYSVSSGLSEKSITIIIRTILIVI